ncbi:MAG: hypothetical protein HFI26_15580 [Lachnospiraceae bacterium]|jgi:hypothetical protein|nr:hypothetical protein [Lachnospiraceae bacterium]
MKTGKITAKLRDAVPVCLMVEGAEVMRYKNIELPDMLKEVEMTDFHFNVHMDGKITFEIHYEPGVLPEVFPEARTRVSRTAKAAAKAEREAVPAEETTEKPAAIPATEEMALALIPEAPVFTAPAKTEEAMPEAETTEGSAAEAAAEPAGEAADEEKTSEESDTMEIFYNVTGPRRKELAAAVGDFIGAKPQYMRAPTYAFVVEGYTIGRDGTLTGAENKALVEALAAQGFKAA